MTYPALLRQLDDWFDRAVLDIGPGVVLCRRGCSACCHGPFDISPADAELVASAVKRLDPATRGAVHARATSQVAGYASIAPQWRAPWDVDAIGDDAFDRLCDAFAPMPCPALGADGGCLIYESRPATCRMIGLPMQASRGRALENACPILDTSAAFASLRPVPFDLETFEVAADGHDNIATAAGWVRTTVAGAIAR